MSQDRLRPAERTVEDLERLLLGRERQYCEAFERIADLLVTAGHRDFAQVCQAIAATYGFVDAGRLPVAKQTQMQAALAQARSEEDAEKLASRQDQIDHAAKAVIAWLTDHPDMTYKPIDLRRIVGFAGPDSYWWAALAKVRENREVSTHGGFGAYCWVTRPRLTKAGSR